MDRGEKFVNKSGRFVKRDSKLDPGLESRYQMRQFDIRPMIGLEFGSDILGDILAPAVQHLCLSADREFAI